MERKVIRGNGISGCDDALDFGCRTGTFLRMILSRFTDVRLSGVDIDPPIMKKAEGKLAGHGADHRLHDGASLPFPDGAFDAVATTVTLQNGAPGAFLICF